jgi:hypothetical protein
LKKGILWAENQTVKLLIWMEMNGCIEKIDTGAGTSGSLDGSGLIFQKKGGERLAQTGQGSVDIGFIHGKKIQGQVVFGQQGLECFHEDAGFRPLFQALDFFPGVFFVQKITGPPGGTAGFMYPTARTAVYADDPLEIIPVFPVHLYLADERGQQVPAAVFKKRV